MPLNTGAALAVSLIPAAVIVLYNLMENGVPGGESIKNFVSFDKISLDGSASSVSLKNISINLNGTGENTIDILSDKLKNLSSQTEAILRETTEFPIEALSVTTDAPVTTTEKAKPTSTTGSTTTTTTTPKTTTTSVPLKLSKLPVCCDKVRVSDGKIVGSCESDLSGIFSIGGSQDGVWNAPAHLMSSQMETKFELNVATSTSCKDGKFIGQLPLVNDAFSVDHFLSDGMLKYKNEYYRPDEYCIRGTTGENILEVQICNINCSNAETPCVQKCCGYEEIYSMGMKGQRGGCLRMDPTRNESTWTPTMYDEFGGRITEEQLALEGIRPHVIQSNPTMFRHLCPRNATTVFPYGQQVADFLAAVLRYPFSSLKYGDEMKDQKRRFMMRKDGWLMNPNETKRNIAISKSTRTTKYCIDGVMNYGEDEPFMNLESQTVLFLCLGAAEEIQTANSKELKSENLVAASSNIQPVSTDAPPTSTSSSTVSTSSTIETTTTPEPSTTSTSTTQAPPKTFQTTSSTQAPSTTVRSTTTSTQPPPTTTLPPSSTTTVGTTQTPSTTSTPLPTTTFNAPTTTLPITTSIPVTSLPTTEAPIPAPVLPVCCSIDPDAGNEQDTENEVSHHCKSSTPDDAVVSVDSAFNSSWIASPNFMFTHKITKFMLEVKPLKCQKWTKAFVHNLGKLLSPTEPVLMPDGMLKMGNDYYRQGEFCVNGVFPNIVEVLVCKTNCSDPQTPCIQKCCAPNEVYSLGVNGKKRGCIPLSQEDTPFEPTLYKNMGTKLTEEELENMTPHLVQKYPPKFQYGCYKNVTLVFPFSSDVVQLMSPLAQINLEFRLRQDGKVIYKHPSIRDASGELIESAFSTYNFCVDGIRNFGESQGPYKSSENQTILFVCAVNPPSKS